MACGTVQTIFFVLSLSTDEAKLVSSKTFTQLHLVVKRSMSAIFGNTLKSQKSHLHQWKPKKIGPVVLN